MKVLAIDVGYGYCKVCYENSQGIRRYEKFISAVGKVGSSAVVQDSNAFEFNGQSYYLFDNALKLPNNQLLDLTTYEGLKEISPIIISYILKKFDLKVDRIVLGLSVAMIEHSGDYLDYISTNLAMPKETFLLVPQGIGSKLAYDMYNLNPEDSTQYSNIRAKNYLGVDIGNNTIDVFQCIGGMVSGQTVKGFKGEGVCKVSFNLIDAIRRDTGIEITLQHSKSILETGVFNYRGVSYNYRDKIDVFIKQYLTEMISLLEKNFKEVIDNMDHIIFIGGGAALLKKYMTSVSKVVEKYYKGDFIIIPELAEFYNCIGYYLLGNK